MTIQITKNQFEALREDISEVTQLQQAAQIKIAANKRHSDTIVADAKLNPKKFINYELETDKNDDNEDVYSMVLIPVPEEPKPTTEKE